MSNSTETTVNLAMFSYISISSNMCEHSGAISTLKGDI